MYAHATGRACRSKTATRQCQKPLNTPEVKTQGKTITYSRISCYSGPFYLQIYKLIIGILVA
jgi:hypothetical protein